MGGLALVGMNVSSPDTFNAVWRGCADAHSDGINQACTGEGEVRSGTAVKDMLTAAQAPHASPCEQLGSAGRRVLR
jgi:fructose-bisphosphate aldolase, class II